jgi:hypothetical protein
MVKKNKIILYTVISISIGFIILFIVYNYDSNSSSHHNYHNYELNKNMLNVRSIYPPTFISDPPIVNNLVVPTGVDISPIIPTQTQPFVNTSYKQVGLLSNDNETLPLLGQQLNRNKWRYYTISNSNLPVKLPIKNNNRSCTGEYGCDELANNDTINMTTNNKPYDVTLYENNTYDYKI